MIDLNYRPTPNGHKIMMFLEEIAMPFTIVPYAIERYVKETNRLYGVLNQRLGTQEFLAAAHSIADMASYPWIVPREIRARTSTISCT